MQTRVRQQIILAGAERCGKTFFAENFASRYVGSGQGGVFAYNPGKPEDFADFYEIEVLRPIEIVKMKGMERREASLFLMEPRLDYFRFKGKIIHFKDFYKVFGGKKVKMFKLPITLERFFFQVVFDYFTDFLLIIDDAKPITRYGLPDTLFQVISRKNHCGHKVEGDRRGKGIDVIFIYHNLDTFSKEIFDYTSRLILFKFMRMPKDRTENEQAFELIGKAYELLKKAPKYERYEIILKDIEEPTLYKGKPLT